MKQFIRGERARLSDLAAINHIWEVGVSIDAPFFIVDFCCLGLDASGQVIDDRYLISFNQPDAPQDAIQMDNASNNGALFTVQLERLPAQVRRLVFTATLHQPEMPGGLVGAAFSFFGVRMGGEIGEGHITLSTPATDAGFFTFSGQDFGEESTLILGEFYWRDEWRFVAAGQPLKGELSTFLGTLTDGPSPVPTSPPPPKAAAPPLAAPPRPPRISAPPPRPVTPPPTPRPTPTAPSSPVLAPARPAAPPVSGGPVELSIAAQPAPISPAPTPSFPQELPPGEKLQDLIDDAEPGATLTLMRDEYEGPIKISKALVLEGRDSALWARSGPVVTVASPDVVLRNLDIEITVANDAPGEKGMALQIEGQAPRLQLDNVRVRGRISGLGDEDGEWQLPLLLNMGLFAARAVNEFHFSIRVPTPVRLSSPVAGVSLLPNEIGVGQHQITLRMQDVAPETLIVGFIEVTSASLVRTVPLTGSAVTGVAADMGREI